jgi:putative membrane protein
MAMGIAEVIPGISGGTIALILGVYERLIKLFQALITNLFFSCLKEK